MTNTIQIHIVTFDSNAKIVQVRQNWDQGSLLKLIDVIGKTGRNWPIRDGKDQIKLIENSIKSSGKPAQQGAVTSSSSSESTVHRSRENSTNVTRDPHASLSLFAPRDQTFSDSLPAVVAPRASAKPAPRPYNDLFVGNDTETSPQTSHSRNRSTSPNKAIAPKGGSGKNYQPSRIFDSENAPLNSREEIRGYRPSPQKFQHFAFADGSDPQDAPKPAPARTEKSKHESTWDFDQFNTPEKVVPGKAQGGADARHWGNENDDIMETPIRPKADPKPRKDAETHFEFVDDGVPKHSQAIGRPRGQGIDNGQGLYRGHNVFDEHEEPTTSYQQPKPLSNITNVKDRSKDFDPHFAMTDDSPAAPRRQGPITENKAKAVHTMEANWSSYDQSPAANQKENMPLGEMPIRPQSKGILSDRPVQENKGITIAGDGMGSRKGTESAAEKAKGINIGGDGMGGAKGAVRTWGFGDDSDGEEAGGLNAASGAFRRGNPGKAQGRGEANGGGGDFWNY